MVDEHSQQEIFISIKFPKKVWDAVMKESLRKLLDQLLDLKYFHDLDFTFSIDEELY